jgi:hypothetical protein
VRCWRESPGPPLDNPMVHESRRCPALSDDVADWSRHDVLPDVHVA